MTPNDLNNLTNIIDNINDTESITDIYLHDNLWNKLNSLRTADNRNELLEGWKYESDFLDTERRHLNGEKMCPMLQWENSFVTYFYLCIYH